MVYLSARDLCRQFDVDPVFRGVTFDVRAGEKVGLVGPNGCGKSTLLALLAGRDEPDIGAVDRPPSVRIGYLEQHASPAEDHTLLEEARLGLAHLYELQHTAHEIAERMAVVVDPAEAARLHDRYDEIHLELTRLDAYHVEHRIDEVLQGLGFQRDDYGRPLATFSGGQQNRAGLARLLLAAPDLLLLDEPTNHLDIETTEWLERYLARSAQAMVLVSHDRYFLDQVTNRTLELWQGGISDYAGNFSAYWKQRDERLKVLRRTFEKQQEFIERQEEFIRRNFAGQKSAQAKDREKKLERVERITLPPDFHDIPMGFPEPARTGDWVLRTDNLSKGFASTDGGGIRPLFTGLTLQIDRGDRVAILGPNGAGKTTLLRTLLGELPPDTGGVRFGTGVQLAYFDQQLQSADPAESAVEAVRAGEPAIGSTPWARSNPYLTPAEVRRLLARFGVTGELALQTVGQMSGGERTKTALARLAALRPNVMLIDEPTNHLDFWACASLERSLHDFTGTLVFVSHDRYFVDRVATKVLVLEDGQWRLHEGNYSDYQHFLAATRAGAPKKTSESSPAGSSTTGKSEALEPADGRRSGEKTERRKRRFPYRKLEDIEADITRCETEIADLEADLVNPEILRDAVRIKQVHADYAGLQDELAQLMEHWEEALELN